MEDAPRQEEVLASLLAVLAALTSLSDAVSTDAWALDAMSTDVDMDP